MRRDMRLLLDETGALPEAAGSTSLDQEALAALYAYPARDGGRAWVRANMVTSLDGAATGPDGRSGSINTGADRQVFALLRALADVIVVGAGTARVERYRAPRAVRGERAVLREGRPAAPALVVVSRSANLPLLLAESAAGALDGSGQHGSGQEGTALGGNALHGSDRDGGQDGDQHGGGEQGEVFLVSCANAEPSALEASRLALGEDHVILAGDDEVDLPAMVAELAGRGLPRILCEGGPHLLRDMAAAGLLDELCLTVVPHLLAGEHTRILAGAGVEVDLAPKVLVEAEGALLGRWFA